MELHPENGVLSVLYRHNFAVCCDLLIDNYDSFSYNLYQLIGEIEPDIKVIRNDEMTIGKIQKLNPDHIILSPGPEPS